MATTVNAGARLDRLPISPFHHRIFWLIGAGMFFDGYDLYVGTTVLGATLQSKFSTLPQNAQFISLTFFGMTIGALITGFLGDRYGRRFTYQFNLMIFGLASLAAAFAPDMQTLNILRFVMGLGLGAEIVVGYSTLTEFVPPKSRGRWLAFMAFLVVSGLPVTTLLGNLIIPTFGWRPMFAIAGVGSIIGASVLTIVFGAIYPFVSEPAYLLTVGFLLIASIYIQVAILFGVYRPELFPTEVRLRANGICNTIGRAATIVSPFIVVGLFQTYRVGGVLSLMIGLLIVQIIVVYLWGVEPRNRPLEDVSAETAPIPV